MVRAAAVAFLFLAGCDRISDTERRSVYADVNANIALKQLDDQRAQISRLERRIDDQEKLTSAYAASLKEARENHTSLLNTFNSNVEKSNKRETAQERDIDWLMRRNGIAR